MYMQYTRKSVRMGQDPHKNGNRRMAAKTLRAMCSTINRLGKRSPRTAYVSSSKSTLSRHAVYSARKNALISVTVRSSSTPSVMRSG